MPAFPSGVHMDPERSSIRHDSGYDHDVDSDNAPLLVKRRRSRTFFNVTLHGLTESKYDEVMSFIETNRAANDIEMTFDDWLAVGKIPGVIDHNKITEGFYEVTFTLIAKRGDVSIVLPDPDPDPDPDPEPDPDPDPDPSPSVWNDADTWNDSEFWTDS